ncbi:MAG: helix-hairpin-helix domain-containing protein [Proteobacteria bacterium]|nr:helix-hairpin-helix domain-containing protein [Pseudomonadota bacterium]MBU1686209.1 helix-hairpin-helix domain-containing protein [Pseudomonadota bacterium]
MATIKKRERCRLSTTLPFTALILVAFLSMLSPCSGVTDELKGQLNINSASLQELTTLPFIGEKRAKALLECRKIRGSFQSLEDLRLCPDIGPDSFMAMRPYLKLSGVSNLTLPSPQKPAPEETLQFRPPPIRTAPGELVLLEDREYLTALLDRIASSRSTIDLAMFLFKTSDSPKNRANLIVKALTDAARRGVAIRLCLEKSNYDDKLNESNENTARKLRTRGIKVTFDSPVTTTHTKMVIIDSRYSLIGSHNLTDSALGRNHELSVLIDNRETARNLTEYFETLVK